MNKPRIKSELEAILLKTKEIERRIAVTLGEEVEDPDAEIGLVHCHH